MKYIDLHCDTLMKTATTLKKNQDLLYENTFSQIDIKKLKENKALLQFFAIFLLDEEYLKYIEIELPEDDDYIDLLTAQVNETIARHPDDLVLIRSFQDFEESLKQEKVGALLTIEDGRSLNNDLNKLNHYYEMGIRLITLTWNHENSVGFPNSSDPTIMSKGLKNFGIEVVEKMNDLGMIIDVSHLSDGGFYDVAKHSKKPFTASHSNARALTNHPRNLTDDMIKIIGETGGIIGLNFAPQFLADPNPNFESRLEDMVRHIDYIRNLAGSDAVAIGTDFDGIEGQFDIAGPQDMHLLFEALEKAGWKEDLLEKFAYQNSIDFLKRTL